MDTESYLGDPRQIINAELLPKEKLLWAGRPPLGMRLRAVDAIVIPFSLMWGGFAIGWETMAVKNHSPFFVELWGIPFVLVGLYITIGRFIADAHVRAHTFYGVTSDRIIIATTSWPRKTFSLNISSTNNFSLLKTSRAGIIDLSTQQLSGGQYRNMWPGMPGYYSTHLELERPEDAINVYNIIRGVQEENQKK